MDICRGLLWNAVERLADGVNGIAARNLALLLQDPVVAARVDELDDNQAIGSDRLARDAAVQALERAGWAEVGHDKSGDLSVDVTRIEAAAARFGVPARPPLDAEIDPEFPRLAEGVTVTVSGLTVHRITDGNLRQIDVDGTT